MKYPDIHMEPHGLVADYQADLQAAVVAINNYLPPHRTDEVQLIGIQRSSYNLVAAGTRRDFDLDETIYDEALETISAAERILAGLAIEAAARQGDQLSERDAESYAGCAFGLYEKTRLDGRVIIGEIIRTGLTNAPGYNTASHYAVDWYNPDTRESAIVRLVTVGGSVIHATTGLAGTVSRPTAASPSPDIQLINELRNELS